MNKRKEKILCNLYFLLGNINVFKTVSKDKTWNQLAEKMENIINDIIEIIQEDYKNATYS